MRDEEPGDDDLRVFGDEDDSTDLVPCPTCGKDVYEYAEYCPACKQFISPQDRTPIGPGARRRWLYIAFLAMAAAAILSWIVL